MPRAISGAEPSPDLDQQRDVGTDPGADRQGGREEAPRDARPHRQPGRDQAQRDVEQRHVDVPFDQSTGVLVAAAEGRAAADDADQRDREAAHGSEGHRMAAPPAAEAIAACADDRRIQEPREEAAEQAAADDHEQSRQDVAEAEARHADDAEVGRIAEHRYGHQPGEHDRGDDQAAAALLDLARELLDGEHDAGERRVEGSGDAGGATCHQQPVLRDRLTFGQPALGVLHDAGGDLHRGTFATDRQAAEQASCGQDGLCDASAAARRACPLLATALGESAAITCGMPEPVAPG